MNQTTGFAWDLFYRDDRFVVYRGRFEIVASLTVLGLVVAVAAAILAWDHHWAPLARVALTFLAYVVTLVGGLKVKGTWRAAEPPPPLAYFVLAGVVAGCLSGLLGLHHPLFLMANTASGIVFGGAHWLAIRQSWRAMMRLLGRRPR
jgi:hypothetical protein